MEIFMASHPALQSLRRINKFFFEKAQKPILKIQARNTPFLNTQFRPKMHAARFGPVEGSGCGRQEVFRSDFIIRFSDFPAAVRSSGKSFSGDGLEAIKCDTRRIYSLFKSVFITCRLNRSVQI